MSSAGVSVQDFLKHPLTNTIVGNGILALALLWLTTFWNASEKARDQERQASEKSRDREKEDRSKKRDLITKTIHNGDAAISVLKSYRDIDIWLKQNKDKPNATYKDLKREKLLDSSLELYKLYVQSPSLESVSKEIELVFSKNTDVKEKAKDLAKLVKRIEDVNDPDVLEKLEKRFKTEMAVLLSAMETDTERNKD